MVEQPTSLLTVDGFEKLLRAGMILRVLVIDHPLRSAYPQGLKETIVELRLCEADHDTNVFYTGLRYSFQEPSDSYDQAVGLQNMYFSQDDGKRRGEIEALLGRWAEEMPLWLYHKLVIVCRKTQVDCKEISILNVGVLEVLARMQTAIAYEIRLQNVAFTQLNPLSHSKPIGGHNAWTLCGIYYALDQRIRQYRSELAATMSQ